MSIAENVGGIYKNLSELRSSNGASANNLFTALGFKYHYVEDGNDVNALIKALLKVKNTTVPVVVHIHTVKGLGCEWAEKDKEAGHFASVSNFSNKEVKCDILDKYKNYDKKILLNNYSEVSNILKPYQSVMFYLTK
jgi:1-deoxy-D-xylulose-5-phosphate synthase